MPDGGGTSRSGYVTRATIVCECCSENEFLCIEIFDEGGRVWIYSNEIFEN